MGEWTPKTLRQIVGQPISGSRPKGGVNSETEGVPSLGGENVLADGGMTFANLNRVPRSFFKSMPKGRLQALDVLINKDGAQTGKVGLYRGEFEEACVNEHLFILRNGDGSVDQRFLYYAVLLPETQAKIQRRITGSAQPGLNTQFVDAVTIAVPSLPEQQRRIAEILETVDEAIEQTEALIAKQQQVKAGLMHDLFTRGLAPDGQLRPSHTEAPELYHETPLGWLPKDWAPDTIGGVSDSLIDGPFGSNLKTEHYVIEPGVRVVRLQNVGATEYDDSERAFISEAHAGFLLKNQVLPGDVLIAGLGEETHVVGRACCYPPDLPPAINKADCFRLRCRAGKMLNAFAMFFLNTAGAQRQIRRYEQGVTRLRINTGNLKKVATGVPGIPEQAAIVEKLQAGIAQVESTHGHLAKLRQLKQGLMQVLLTPPS